jgi:hypothetical protein
MQSKVQSNNNDNTQQYPDPPLDYPPLFSVLVLVEVKKLGALFVVVAVRLMASIIDRLSQVLLTPPSSRCLCNNTSITTTIPPTLSASKRAASQISEGTPDDCRQQAADGAINAKARSRSTKAQTKANEDTKLLLANYDLRDDIEVNPAELPEEKKFEASGNNTEQWNRNHKGALAFAKAYL